MEDQAQEQQTGQEEQSSPAEEQVEQAPAEQQEHEPPPDHPRFKEVYGRMKNYERVLVEKDQAWREMQEVQRTLMEHNAKLSEALGVVQDEVSKGKRPDPVEDPDGFAEWTIAQAERRMRREAARAPVPPVPPQQQQPPRPPEKLRIQEEIMAEMNPEYWDAFRDVSPEMQANPSLNQHIWSAPNPPLALFNYWKKSKVDREKQRKSGLSQGYVEGGSAPPGDGGGMKPTATDRKTADMLNIPLEKYMKQKAFIANRGY